MALNIFSELDITAGGDTYYDAVAKAKANWAIVDAWESSITTLADDGTPSVAAGKAFKTGGTTTITDFDGGVAGQRITVLSKHAVTFDTTTAQDADHNLDGSSGNIVTASGDITEWLCEDGTTWHLIRFNDASADNS